VPEIRPVLLYVFFERPVERLSNPSGTVQNTLSIFQRLSITNVEVVAPCHCKSLFFKAKRWFFSRQSAGTTEKVTCDPE
jgi:metal-dependent hydrolase (beta-lactamase superfamily II)